MAAKLTQLPALGAAPAETDLMYVVDMTGPSSLSMTVRNLFTQPTIYQPDITVEDNATTTISRGSSLIHETSGTPGAGFGISEDVYLDDDTGSLRIAGAYNWWWLDPDTVSSTPAWNLALYIGGAVTVNPFWVEADPPDKAYIGIGANAGSLFRFATVSILGNAGETAFDVVNDDAASPAAIIRGATNQTDDLLQLFGGFVSPLVAYITASGGAVFNEAGLAGGTVRIEGTTDPNLLFTDPATDQIGIGTNAPTAKLNIVGNFVTRPVTLTDAATIAVNAALSNQFTVTLTDNRVLGNPTNATDGQVMIFQIITGGFTLTFDTKFQFGTDIAGYSPSTATDYITVRYDAAADQFCVVAIVRGY